VVLAGAGPCKYPNVFLGKEGVFLSSLYMYVCCKLSIPCIFGCILNIHICTHIALAGGIFTASLDGCPGVGPPSAKQQFVRGPKRLLFSLSLSTVVLLENRERDKKGRKLYLYYISIYMGV
jgi:hypothetical protein